MKSPMIRLAVAAVVTAYCVGSVSAASLADFELRYVPGTTREYYLYVPPNMDPAKSYPVIQYLASSGQTSAASTVSHPNVTDCVNWAKDPDHEAFVFVPFNISTQQKIDVFDDLAAPGNYGSNFDLTRVYTTGWSLGAIGSFRSIGDRPDRFAAAAPMAGWTVHDVSAYANTPIWAFNGSQDYTCPPSGVTDTFQAEWDAGNYEHVLYTEVIGGDHSSTPRNGYAEPGLFPWMFAQSTTTAPDQSMFVGWAKNGAETKNLIGPAQSISRTDQYFVGYYGTGQLNIYSGATVDSADGYIAVDGRAHGQAVINGAGSQWNADGNFYVGYRGGADATLTVVNGGELNVTEKLIVIPGSDIELNGGNITAATMTLDGIVHVNLEALQQPGAGKIEIAGYAKMNGTLDVQLPEDISTVAGKKTVIATFASRSDDMHGLTYTELEDDLILAPTLSPTELAVTVTYKGDANLDGIVGLIDLDILGQNYGQLCDGKILCGDFSGNGSVTLTDLDILGANWGRGTSTGTPEPASLGLLITAAAFATRRRR